ncbi:uncharacterized protein LOC122663101 [Telopea speciosissima]|uniref:uncharacterized protein LOC122663101 n=1 Tax=Telopea speciosissima TaxID=54955 RepID=UPI001CC7F2C6|nr:uncharacterized protein LOC122663101 [Telopea speciosissima]
MATSVTVEELKWFHSIDRDIFTILVINFGRNIAESMRIIGLWLWLEEMGFPNIILPLLSSSDAIVELVAREAVLCLNCIDKDRSPAGNEIPSTKRLMKREISLSFIRKNRVSAVGRISQFVSEIGLAFTDIVEKAVNNRSKVMGSHASRVRPIGSSFKMGGPSSAFLPWSSSCHPKKGMASLSASSDERTIFVTFSRGYPVSESELRNFFNMKYGECVECIYMQEVSAYGQALFARVVFRSIATMAVILQGMENDGKVKLLINGKHVRARKYFSK